MLEAEDAIPITVTVNGRAFSGNVAPRLLLADFLRHHAGLKGTHIGCEHGVCGACTVHLNGRSARSCITFAIQADRGSITTVEGLAGNGSLTRLQDAFHRCHALQCGYCTPGFLMVLTEFLQQHPDPTDAQIVEALSGNLCRCTGYINMIAAVKLAIKESR
jgi:aerobic-type carbon monoxide dehydrogenase small subunit (CoxS/CutS family)